ncbi:MAG: hypothetical protein IJY25_04255 [Bacilli bacterium]|nr:hypothetical protein [Bacilli bacterium]
MNKTFKVFILLFVLFITGCGKDKYITCKSEITNKENNYTLTATYKIYYKDAYVTKIEKEEIYKSSSEDIIEYFDEYKNLEYDNLNDLYGGYSYTIDSNKDFIKLNAVIDINNVDVKQMIKNGYLDKDYTISNKLTTSGAKYFYKEKGATCDI